MRDQFKYPGIPIGAEDVECITRHHTVGKGDAKLEHFQNSLGKLRLRGKNNYWQTVAKFFPDVDDQCFQCIDIGNSKKETVPTSNESQTNSDVTHPPNETTKEKAETTPVCEMLESKIFGISKELRGKKYV